MTDAHKSFQSRRSVVLTLTIGSGGILVLGIQPVLLGGLLQAGRIDAVELGQIATAEVLGMAAGVLLAARVFAGAHGRSAAIAAGILMAAANFVTPLLGGAAAIVAARLVAGLSEGAMVAAAVLTIAHGAAPGRLNAIYLTAGAMPQLVLAYLLPALLIPAFGVRAGFDVLAATGLLCAGLANSVRDRLAPPREASAGSIAWTAALVLALAATLVTAAAIGAGWSYAEPMGAQAGLSPDAVGAAIAISLGAQIAGSLFVALVGYRLPFRIVLPLSVILQAVSMAVLAAGPHVVLFCAALAVFGFCWQAGLPFAMDLIVDLDASRASAPLIMPLTLAGFSAGPLLASGLVGERVTGAFLLGLGTFLVAGVIYSLLFRMSALRVRAQASG